MHAAGDLPRPLKPGERLDLVIHLADVTVAVTEHSLIVGALTGRMLDIRFSELRRIEFDIERARPATLIIVPERPSDPPQVLAVEPEQYFDVASLVVLIGHRLGRGSVSPPGRASPD